MPTSRALATASTLAGASRPSGWTGRGAGGHAANRRSTSSTGPRGNRLRQTVAATTKPAKTPSGNRNSAGEGWLPYSAGVQGRSPSQNTSGTRCSRYSVSESWPAAASGHSARGNARASSRQPPITTAAEPAAPTMYGKPTVWGLSSKSAASLGSEAIAPLDSATAATPAMAATAAAPPSRSPTCQRRSTSRCRPSHMPNSTNENQRTAG